MAVAAPVPRDRRGSVQSLATTNMWASRSSRLQGHTERTRVMAAASVSTPRMLRAAAMAWAVPWEPVGITD